MYKNKKGLEMGFAWMFAIIVGVAILLLAIFGASRYIDIGQREITTKTSADLINVLDKLQTGVEEGSSDKLLLSVDARIFTSCNLDGVFGESSISTAEQIGFGETWSRTSNRISTKNNYLFAEDKIEGREITFLAFPFKMPFKSGDIIIAFTEDYCFIDPPESIDNELRNLAGNKILITNDLSVCGERISVCFSGNCDIHVTCTGNCEFGTVEKNNRELFFVDKLLYGAIFSSKDNYECNTERLVKRLESVSNIYLQKAQLVATKGCDTGLVSDLNLLENKANAYERLNDLNSIDILSEKIKETNKGLECQLF